MELTFHYLRITDLLRATRAFLIHLYGHGHYQTQHTWHCSIGFTQKTNLVKHLHNPYPGIIHIPGLVVEEVDERALHDCVHDPCWFALKIFDVDFP